jgi:hypothetical protein
MLKPPSKALRRRVAELVAKRREKASAIVIDIEAVADYTIKLLKWFDDNDKAVRSGRACPIQKPPDENELARKAGRQFSYWPRAMDDAMKRFDATREKLKGFEREAAAERKAAKTARRAARRAQAALQQAQPEPVHEHGLPITAHPAPPPPAIVPPPPATPAPMGSLRF